MAAGLFCRLDHLLHGSLGLTETDIIGDGVVEEVDVLEDEGIVFHQGIHVVVPDVSSSQGHGSGIGVPEPGQQVDKGGLAASGRSHDGRRGLLRYVHGDPVNDFSFLIGEFHILRMQIPVLRPDLLSGDVHLGCIQDLLRSGHAGIHHPQKRGVIAGCLQAGVDDESRDHHDNCREGVHGPPAVKEAGQGHHADTGQLGQKALDRHTGDQGHLHIGVDYDIGGNGVVELPALGAGQVIGLDLRHALQVFQHLLDQALIGIDFAACKSSGRLLQETVGEQKEAEPGQ